eukprot:6049632-Pleurochrysis_carterae.AAC.1
MACSGDGFVRRLVAARWSGCTVKYVQCVDHGEVPEVRRYRRRNKVRPGELHDGTYSPFRHSVELVHVGWTSRCVNANFRYKIGETGGEELARVVRVKRADEALRFRSAFVQEGRERGEESANM